MHECRDVIVEKQPIRLCLRRLDAAYCSDMHPASSCILKRAARYGAQQKQHSDRKIQRRHITRDCDTITPEAARACTKSKGATSAGGPRRRSTYDAPTIGILVPMPSPCSDLPLQFQFPVPLSHPDRILKREMRRVDS